MTDPTDKKSQREPAKIDLGLHPKNEEKPTGPAAESADSSQGKPQPPKLKLDAPDQSPKQPTASQEDKDQAPETAAPTERPKIKIGLDEPMEEPPGNQGEQPAPPKRGEIPPQLKMKAIQRESGEDSTAQPQAKEEQDEPPEKEGKGDPLKDVAQESSKQSSPRSEEIQEESLEELYKAALNRTQRVVLDDQQKKATGAIDRVPVEPEAPQKTEVSESSKKSTAQLDVQEMLSDTGRIDIPKDEAAAAGSEGAAQEMPNTVRIPRAPAHDTSAEDSGKSATARIDLPPDATTAGPPTQRKTIRIKRPDAASTSSRKMTVARTPEKEGKKKPAGDGETSAPTIQFDSDEDRTHPAFVIAAAAAVLISLALVYILVATVIPDLPFPGRMV